MFVCTPWGTYPAIVVRCIVLTTAIVACSFLCLLVASQPARAATHPVAYDYVVLIDTSKSMAGYGGAQVIFPKVKTAVNHFVESLDLGQSVVYVYTFDSGLRTRAGIRLRTQSDKARVEAIINGLRATGETTAIYTSLGETLKAMRQVRLSSPDKTHVQTILLFTDGRDNQSGDSFGQIASQFRLAKGENPYLFLKYVTLGTTADPRWKSIDGVDVVTNPPGVLQQLQSVRVLPVDLDFGSLQSSDTSERVIQISFDKGLQGATVGISASSQDAESAGGLVSVEPANVELNGTTAASGSLVMTQTLTLRVQNRTSLDQNSAYSGRIDLSVAGGKLVTLSPPSIAFRFTMAAEPQITIDSAGETLNGGFGTIDPYHGATSHVEATRSCARCSTMPLRPAERPSRCASCRRPAPARESRVFGPQMARRTPRSGSLPPSRPAASWSMSRAGRTPATTSISSPSSPPERACLACP